MKNKLKLFILLIFIFIIALIFLIKPFHTGETIETSDSSKPSPRVMDIKCEKFYSNSLPKINLTASIKNFGENGGITIIGEIDPVNNEKSILKTKKIYLKRDEMREVFFYFDIEDIVDANCFAKAYSS